MFYISEKTSIVWFSIFTSNTAKVEYILPLHLVTPDWGSCFIYMGLPTCLYSYRDDLYTDQVPVGKTPMEAHGSFQWHDKETFTFNCEMITGIMLM